MTGKPEKILWCLWMQKRILVQLIRVAKMDRPDRESIALQLFDGYRTVQGILESILK